jgi:hypothetical protein
MNNSLEYNEEESEAYFDKLMQKYQGSGFTTPTGYFDQLKEETIAKVGLEQLKNKVVESGFEVPAGYFESLSSKIQKRIQEEQVPLVPTLGKAPVKVVKLWQSSIFKYASAACFVLVVTCGIYFNQNQNVSKTNFAAISTTDQDLYDIDEQYIIEDLSTKKEAIKNPVTAATKAELESYILNNYSQSDISGSL